MQAAARSPAHHRLRLGAGTGSLFLIFLTLSRQLTAVSGPFLFQVMHSFLLTMLLLIGPVLTADTVAREKREGTLDLLFLTPLTAAKIISSKFAVQALRLLGLWLVCVPFVTIPFLAGGVDTQTVLLTLAVELSVLCLALVSGLAVSVFGAKPFPAIILSLLLALLVNLANATLLGASYLSANQRGLGNLPEIAQNYFGLGMGLVLIVMLPLAEASLAKTAGASGVGLGFSIAANTLVIVLLTGGLVRCLGLLLARRNRNAGETVRQLWFRRVFLTPVLLKNRFRQVMRCRLDRNPLIWLEYRTAWSRGGRWLVVAAVVAGESFFIARAAMREMLGLQVMVGFVLLLLLSLTAASTFQNEKETGALELLLVAPFTENSLVKGRLQAVWSYYLPVTLTVFGFVLLGWTWMSGGGAYYGEDDGIHAAHALSVVLSLLTIPVAGLYFALRLKSFLAILTGTALAGLIAPFYCWDFLRNLVWYSEYMLHWPAGPNRWLDPGGGLPFWLTIFLHAALIVFFFDKTIERLRARNFSF
jgi:ABC-type transport system involved in multi-copper enzyme maturation permease subunit